MRKIWDDLPQELHILVPFAEKYGKLQFDDAIYAHLDTISSDEIAYIKSIGTAIYDEWSTIQQYIIDHPIVEYESGRLLYFLLHFLALGNDVGKL